MSKLIGLYIRIRLRYNLKYEPRGPESPDASASIAHHFARFLAVVLRASELRSDKLACLVFIFLHVTVTKVDGKGFTNLFHHLTEGPPFVVVFGLSAVGGPAFKDNSDGGLLIPRCILLDYVAPHPDDQGALAPLAAAGEIVQVKIMHLVVA